MNICWYTRRRTARRPTSPPFTPTYARLLPRRQAPAARRSSADDGDGEWRLIDQCVRDMTGAAASSEALCAFVCGPPLLRRPVRVDARRDGGLAFVFVVVNATSADKHIIKLLFCKILNFAHEASVGKQEA